jgi:polysaccharide biosynthesis/export protein
MSLGELCMSKSMICSLLAAACACFAGSVCAADEPSRDAAAATRLSLTDKALVGSATSKSAASANQDEYRIGPQDLLEIQVFQSEQLSRTVRVNSNGLISLPMAGAIKAGGLTGQELEAALVERLAATYMQDPQVSVFIKEYTSQRVTIEGYVKKAGIYPLRGRTTLIQAIAMAEGMDSIADLSEVRVFRNVDGEKSVLVFNVESIRAGKAEDPVVRGDDIIEVDSSTSKSLVKNVTDTLRGFLSFAH